MIFSRLIKCVIFLFVLLSYFLPAKAASFDDYFEFADSPAPSEIKELSKGFKCDQFLPWTDADKNTMVKLNSPLVERHPETMQLITNDKKIRFFRMQHLTPQKENYLKPQPQITTTRGAFHTIALSDEFFSDIDLKSDAERQKRLAYEFACIIDLDGLISNSRYNLSLVMPKQKKFDQLLADQIKLKTRADLEKIANQAGFMSAEAATDIGENFALSWAQTFTDQGVKDGEKALGKLYHEDSENGAALFKKKFQCLLQADQAFVRGDYQAAMAPISKAIEIAPDDGVLYSERAIYRDFTFELPDRLNDALSEHDQELAKANLTDLESAFRLFEPYKIAPESRLRRIRRDLAIAKSQCSRVDEACLELRKLNDEYPGGYKNLTDLVKVEIQNNELENADKDLKDFAQLGVLNSDFFCLKAELEASRKHWSQALWFIEFAINLQPDREFAIAKRGRYNYLSEPN